MARGARSGARKEVDGRRNVTPVLQTLGRRGYTASVVVIAWSIRRRPYRICDPYQRVQHSLAAVADRDRGPRVLGKRTALLRHVLGRADEHIGDQRTKCRDHLLVAA